MLLCFLQPAKAQTAAGSYPANQNKGYSYGYKKSTGRYFTIYTGFGEILSHNSPVNLFVNFPFWSTAHGNIPENFTVIKTNMSPKNFALFDVLHFSYGDHLIFFDAGIGGLTKMGGVSSDFNSGLWAGFGTGVNIPFDFFAPKKPRAKRFFLKAAINLTYNNFNLDMGYISNSGTQINVMGLTAAPTFTYTAGSKYYHYTATGYAENLKVAVDENYWVFAPKLSLTSNPNTHIFYWGIDAAYYFPHSHHDYLTFTQTAQGSNVTHEVGKVSLTNNNLTLLNNNVRSTTLPFNFNCFYIGFNIGVNINSLNN
jgi:hypothetical protein